MGKAKWFFYFSGCILLVCALAMSGKGINFGIDFNGGTRITASLQKPATVEQVRNTLAPLGLKSAEIQTLQNKELGPHVVQISTKNLGPARIDKAESLLKAAYGFRGEPNEDSI